MLAAYGFGLFPLPAYREARVGEWRVVRQLPSLADGYASGTLVEGRRHVLYHGRTAWMSTGLMEQESHAYHVHQARGLVVVAGLGMGMYAYAASLKPEVERVVLVEREPAVVELMTRATRLGRWPGREKLALLPADALGPDLAPGVAAATGGRRPDYLFADIWPACPAPEAPAETAAMVRALRPRAAGWWGQELSFGLWCREEGRPPDEAALRDYFMLVGVPAPVSPGYAAFCGDVVAVGLPEARRPGRVASLRALWRRLLRRTG